MDQARCDIAIVGGGIVGLATALAITESFPRYRVAVIEKEPNIAQHQTGHNSGVIHSGIYYRPGSHKANLCVEGARLLTRFCEESGVRYEVCGKVVVAAQERELPGLANLYQRGLANGVQGLELVGPERLKELEPHSRGLQGLLSPSTGIVDYREVAQAMAQRVSQGNAEVIANAEVVGVRSSGSEVRLQTSQGEVTAERLINCAGLYADEVAKMAGAPADVKIIPFRGEYYTLRPESRHLVKGLIYPVPDPRFPFLGVHFTRTIGGETEAGPNAVLAFAREGYRKGDFNPSEALSTISYPGFWLMAKKYWKTGAYEFYRSISKRAFVGALRRLLPELEEGNVAPGGSGVRAQAVDRRGVLLDDFLITHTQNAIHVLNAPSPAATASLAIGRYIADRAKETFELVN